MLKNNQDFGAVEMELKKFKSTTFGQRKAGSWVTKHHLMSTLGWTKIHECTNTNLIHVYPNDPIVHASIVQLLGRWPTMHSTMRPRTI